MSLWAWFAIGATTLVGLVVAVGLCVGLILQKIGDEASQTLERECWAMAPLTRSSDRPATDSSTAPDSVLINSD